MPILKVEYDIPYGRVLDLLVSCFESGAVGYWCPFLETFTGYVNGKDQQARGNVLLKMERHNGVTDEEMKQWGVDGSWTYARLLTVSGMMRVKHEDTSDENKMTTASLNLQQLYKGLATMARVSPQHFQMFVSEGEDAEVADVWLQCCLFGKIIFG